ncbi:MAG: hypothetical protein LC708_03290, partial [Actinobacteria bacterium]|nr:hypothetical protein [Actinomycetota bacterium]
RRGLGPASAVRVDITAAAPRALDNAPSCATCAKSSAAPRHATRRSRSSRFTPARVGLHNVEIVDEVVVDGHPRIVALMRSAT